MSKTKKLLNLHEEATHERLKKACEPWGSSIYAMVRVADVFPLEGSGIDSEHFSFALKSHFDFLVTDSEYNPLFAVEFDGPKHSDSKQSRRDALKDAICERFDFPILRINYRYLPEKYRKMDLLSWFVEVWFSNRAFMEAQEKGQIPWDEGFDPGSIFSIPDKKGRFPLWLSLDARAEIERLFKRGECIQRVPACAVATDPERNYRAIAYLMIHEDQGIMVETAMRNQRFPVPAADVLEDIAILELFEKLKIVLKGLEQRSLLSKSAIEHKCSNFVLGYRMLRAGGPGDSVLFLRDK
jgi:hypothetical protein